MDLYRRRITRYTDFSVIPVEEEKISHGCNETLIKQKEGDRILEKIPVFLSEGRARPASPS